MKISFSGVWWRKGLMVGFGIVFLAGCAVGDGPKVQADVIEESSVIEERLPSGRPEEKVYTCLTLRSQGSSVNADKCFEEVAIAQKSPLLCGYLEAQRKEICLAKVQDAQIQEARETGGSQ